MIIAQARFELKEPLSLAAATEIFESTAPKYKGVPGLHRKIYLLSEDGGVVSALYFWENRAAAEAFYGPAWRDMVSSKYGVEPTLAYFEAPVVVENT